MKKIVTSILIACIFATTAFAGLSAQAGDKIVAHEIAEIMRSRGYSEDNPIIQACSAWWWELDAEEKAEIAPQPTEEKYRYTTNQQWAEYPVATQCYEYLRGNMGLSPAVAAGIIGGWMEECGGQTLNLQYWIYGGSGKYTYYGLAMWSMLYCPEIGGATLEQQLDYFAQTARKNVEYFGGSWDYFTSLTDPGAVVSYYYTYYGRGYGSASRQRIRNGYTAQSYFGGA